MRSQTEHIVNWFERGVNTYGGGDKESVIRQWRTLDRDTLESQIQGSIRLLGTTRKTFDKTFKQFFGIPLSSITDFAP